MDSSRVAMYFSRSPSWSSKYESAGAQQHTLVPAPPSASAAEPAASRRSISLKPTLSPRQNGSFCWAFSSSSAEDDSHSPKGEPGIEHTQERSERCRSHGHRGFALGTVAFEELALSPASRRAATWMAERARREALLSSLWRRSMVRECSLWPTRTVHTGNIDLWNARQLGREPTR
ncbi:hypothetical protein HPB50_006919 [Hyalomma asiaticum]|uniref:Uncharacterized protein n=1 Tax=Hyalomma asiaticum TaxID=266040 RepID=A0ACB7TBY9_HYAAI|nr:hypothetical protein HPB50_006919 [Hyalomma asiaticum]